MRTIALRRVYAANGLKAQQYREWLAGNADRFGLAPEQVEGMRRPVLVRVRATPVNRAEFARQANAPSVAAMSPREQESMKQALDRITENAMAGGMPHHKAVQFAAKKVSEGLIMGAQKKAREPSMI
jgi:hypothetical protein